MLVTNISTWRNMFNTRASSSSVVSPSGPDRQTFSALQLRHHPVLICHQYFLPKGVMTVLQTSCMNLTAPFSKTHYIFAYLSLGKDISYVILLL